jgi:hypothetical protein
MEKEKWTERSEYISDLHRLRNYLIAQIVEVDMAIMREENAHDAKKAKTVTQQTKELLHKSQRIIPPYESLIQ